MLCIHCEKKEIDHLGQRRYCTYEGRNSFNSGRNEDFRESYSEYFAIVTKVGEMLGIQHADVAKNPSIVLDKLHARLNNA